MMMIKICTVPPVIRDGTVCIHYLNDALLKVHPAFTSSAVTFVRKHHNNCLNRLKQTKKSPISIACLTAKKALVLKLAQWRRHLLILHTVSEVSDVRYVRLHWFVCKIHSHASNNVIVTERAVIQRNDYMRWVSNESSRGEAEKKFCEKKSVHNC